MADFGAVGVDELVVSELVLRLGVSASRACQGIAGHEEIVSSSAGGIVPQLIRRVASSQCESMFPGATVAGRVASSRTVAY